MESQPAQKQWYVLKAAKKFGPFSYREMIEMTQNMQIFEFDYVWAQGMKAWTPLAEIEEFSKSNIEKYVKSSEASGAFHKRSHPRVEFTVEVIVHNDDIVWRGRTDQISEGGALIAMANPLLLPGQIVNINFKKKSHQDISFNVVGEILGKRYTKDRIQHDTLVVYAVKFLRKEKSAEEQLKKWIETKLQLK